MRMLLKVRVPTESGNAATDDGSIAKVIGETFDRLQPEAAYFGLEKGERTAYVFFDMKTGSDMPSIAEPLYHALNASLSATPVMSLDELQTGLEQWGRSQV